MFIFYDHEFMISVRCNFWLTKFTASRKACYSNHKLANMYKSNLWFIYILQSVPISWLLFHLLTKHISISILKWQIASTEELSQKMQYDKRFDQHICWQNIILSALLTDDRGKQILGRETQRNIHEFVDTLFEFRLRIITRAPCQ